ncbi:MAG: DEAD/DEAH box helicase family protein, partial [Myxococcota bacterium]|nr:DEAD/DEAH box helicase family protein [Myxococcota bacterium]
MCDPAWQNIDAGSPLRRYQQRAVDALVTTLSEDGARVCLVAPPGAGKTRCALHVAAALERPVEVRVPTTALVRQWQDRIATSLVATVEGEQAPVRVDTYAGGGAPVEGALVILDEAFQGLDPGAVIRFRDRLEAFGEGGGGALVCSHDLSLLARV